MTPDMREQMKYGLPWSNQAIWWVILVEGILAISFGLFLLLFPQTAFVDALIAVYLIVDGILILFKGMQQQTMERTQVVKMLRGAVGITAGFVVFIPRVLLSVSIIAVDAGGATGEFVTSSALFNNAAYRVLLSVAGVGLTIWALTRFWEAFLARDTNLRMSSITFALVALVLGISALIEVITLADLAIPMGIFFLIGGIALLVVAIFQRSRLAQPPQPATPTTADTQSTPTSSLPKETTTVGPTDSTNHTTSE